MQETEWQPFHLGFTCADFSHVIAKSGDMLREIPLDQPGCIAPNLVNVCRGRVLSR